MRMFSKFISAKIYPNMVAALEHDNAEMLMLKRPRCNVVNDLTCFICVEALPARGVLLNSASSHRRYSCSVNMRQTHLVDCFQSRRFLNRRSCKSSKNVLELLVAQMVYFFTCKLVS